MPSTYANDLRLEIIATGEQSGTWGDTTNDNLALIAEGLSYGAEDLSSDANATITMADGATDAVRSLYLKITSSATLTATRTITLAPNTVSKVWIIENATTGSQSITIKQGTGNTVTVANGAVKAVYSDGAGAGAAVNDALVDLDLTGTSTIAGLKIGGDGATVTGIKDEDNMASNSAVKLATQQSIKAYVDSQVGTVDTLAEILANGNTTGANNIVVSSGQAITTNTISETTAASGVTIDSVLLKDNAVTATTFTGALVGNVTGNASGTAATVTGAAQAAITSVGTLTTLTVDDITINANTISSGGASTLAITPTAGQAITFDGTVTLDAGVIAGATSITSTAFVGALTGNASTATALETARTIGGVSFNGTAAIVPATITVADTTDTTSFVGLWESATGDLAPKTDAAITYNAGTGALTATTFVGALTGNASGTSATVTGATQAAITTAANLVTVGALDSGSITSGFGNINNGSSTLTSGASTLASVNIASDGATVTGIKDEDNMASNSAVKLATQQSIKAYVDSSVATADTLSEVLALGNTTGGTDIATTTTDKVQFRDAAIYINSSTDGQLDIVADTEIQIAATTIDINGAINASGEIIAASLDISGNIDVDGTTNLDVVDIDGAVDMASTLGVTGVVTANAGVVVDNITIDGTEIDLSSGSLTIDVAGDIYIDADGGDIVFKDGGTDFLEFSSSSSNATLKSSVSDKDMIFQGNDGGSTITALTLDMSAAGAAFFNSDVNVDGYLNLRTTDDQANKWLFYTHTDDTLRINYNGSGNDELVISTTGGLTHISAAGGDVIFNEGGIDADFRVESNGNANMLFVDGGNDSVGIGTGAPSSTYKLDVAGAVRSTGNAPSFNLQESDASNQHWVFGSYAGTLALRDVTGGTYPVQIANSGVTTNALNILAGETVINDNSADRDFRVESDSNTHMLFVDGGNNNLLIGNTVVNPASGFSAIAGFGYAASGQVQIAATSNLATLVLGQNQGTNGSIVDFRKQGTIVGTISVTGSATAYNTSSDQRLKQNIQDADDAGSSIDAIQVRKFDWIDSGDHQPYGMVAQELQTVAPEAVSAPEDPDEMMGVDYSKLVPMLVKEIQTLRNRVAQLENN